MDIKFIANSTSKIIVLSFVCLWSVSNFTMDKDRTSPDPAAVDSGHDSDSLTPEGVSSGEISPVKSSSAGESPVGSSKGSRSSSPANLALATSSSSPTQDRPLNPQQLTVELQSKIGALTIDEARKREMLALLKQAENGTRVLVLATLQKKLQEAALGAETQQVVADQVNALAALKKASIEKNRLRSLGSGEFLLKKFGAGNVEIPVNEIERGSVQALQTEARRPRSSSLRNESTLIVAQK